jgi:predicted membrane channel-forming protein YqfA (hemolysin III family)
VFSSPEKKKKKKKKQLNIFVISVYVLYWECRKSLSTKLYANSLIGVGVASSLYHSSRGKLRQFMRWTDYTMIATATVVSQG